MTNFFEPGTHVVRRGIAHGAVWIVHTMWVVEDSPEQTLLLQVPGSPCKIPSGLIQRKYAPRENSDASRWDEQENPPWQLVDWIWQRRCFLVFMEPGTHYAINLVWEGDSRRFLGWYINFETPFRRSPVGFDTLDLELDLEVRPDYSLHWKDTEEYTEGIRRGAISAETAKQVERAKRQILRKVEQREEPFDGSWNWWRPQEDWGIPTLRPGWQKVDTILP